MPLLLFEIQYQANMATRATIPRTHALRSRNTMRDRHVARPNQGKARAYNGAFIRMADQFTSA